MLQVGIALEVRIPGTTQSAAFVVAAKELRASILAGSQVRHQLQSGAGPLTVQVGQDVLPCCQPSMPAGAAPETIVLMTTTPRCRWLSCALTTPVRQLWADPSPSCLRAGVL